MLRLKQALRECGIQQQELVKVSRYGKSQISQTLNTGILPADGPAFAQDVEKFVEAQPRITEWLNAAGMRFKHLFDVLPESGIHKICILHMKTRGPPTWRRALLASSGFAVSATSPSKT